MKEKSPNMPTKSGLMLGLGETTEEILSVCADLRAVGCEMITIGQYLQPTRASARFLSLQDRLVFELSNRSDTQGGLLMCEHPPLITVGREGSREHILASPQELISRELDVRWLNRGGGCLVHAPG